MKTMTIKGMMCAHCSGRVEKALNDLPGVTATVNLEAGTASVQGDVTNEVLTKAVTDAGYEVVSIGIRRNFPRAYRRRHRAWQKSQSLY